MSNFNKILNKTQHDLNHGHQVGLIVLFLNKMKNGLSHLLHKITINAGHTSDLNLSFNLCYIKKG